LSIDDWIVDWRVEKQILNGLNATGRSFSATFQGFPFDTQMIWRGGPWARFVLNQIA